MEGGTYAALAALAAAVTAVSAKAGVRGVPSNLATAIRTFIVLVLAWVIAIAWGEHERLSSVSARSFVFLALSGVTTGVSWLAYFKALSLAPASRVAPVDKASLALTVVMAVLLLGEVMTVSLGIGVALIVVGAFMTLTPDAGTPADKRWWAYAVVASIAASMTAILAKIGIEGVPSSLATALRCVIVAAFAWGIVLARGEHRGLRAVSGRSALFLVVSGVGTGLSWLAYYHALTLAPASHVAAIDKASLGFTIVLAAVFLKERITARLAVATALIVAGALLTLIQAS